MTPPTAGGARPRALGGLCVWAALAWLASVGLGWERLWIALSPFQEVRASWVPGPSLGGHQRPLRTARGGVRVDGPFGVLEESPSPLVVLDDDEDDPMFRRLVAAVQAADQKRGVDITAFWINEGHEIMVLVTALSRPQLYAITQAIEMKMRKELRQKRFAFNEMKNMTLREEATSGWCLLKYSRLSVHIMTPVQRNYYDIEGTWRDVNKDYQKIPLDGILREDGFGFMSTTKSLGSSMASAEAEAKDEFQQGGAEEEETSGAPAAPEAEGLDYEEDEDDPFWS